MCSCNQSAAVELKKGKDVVVVEKNLDGGAAAQSVRSRNNVLGSIGPTFCSFCAVLTLANSVPCPLTKDLRGSLSLFYLVPDERGPDVGMPVTTSSLPRPKDQRGVVVVGVLGIGPIDTTF